MSRPSPDPQGRDEDVMEQSESLDEDDMGVDPLEAGMDPPEAWSGSGRHGTTASEQAEDRPLEDRLREERPDLTGEPVPERPTAATPLEELDESIDDEVVPAEPTDEQGRVLVGDEADDTGEASTRRGGHLIAEPDQPATDEVAIPRQE